MKIAKVRFTGVSRLSFSRHYDVPKLNKEQPKDYEERTWRERMHYDENGEIYIPPTMVKNCLSAIAKYLSMQVPGKNKATYTKHFEAGVQVLEPMMMGIKKDDVPGEWLFVPADGKRGGTKRVSKCFPLIEKGWTGEVNVYILDDTITRDVFELHMKEAGRFIGLGRFRPRQNGYYGRFDCEILEWK